MTDKQPEPLRLADVFDKEGYAVFTDDMWKAAAELRRLHAENSDFRATIDHLTRENAEQIGEIVALKEQRDERVNVRAAVHRLHAAKNRYHTQIAACDLFDLFGLKNERPTK